MYYYEVNFWDEIDDKQMTETGLCSGGTYGEAADNLVKYYGMKNVIDIKLTELENVICSEEINEYFKS